MLNQPTAKKLKSGNEHLYYLLTGISAGIIFVFIMGICGYLPGGRLLFSSDSVDEVATVSKWLWDRLLHGQDGFYSWSLSFGGNAALTNAFYGYNPLNILLLFVPEHYAVIMIMALKVFFATAFMSLFLIKVLGCNKHSAFLFSLFYGISSYQIHFYQNMCLVDGVLFLPIVLWALYMFLKNEGKHYGICLSITYALIFIVQFYDGFLVGFFSLIFLCGYILFNSASLDKCLIKKLLLSYFYYTIAAVFISMIILYPALIDIISRSSLADSYLEKRNILNYFYGLLWGIKEIIYVDVPYAYCGVLTLVLFFVYVFDDRFPKKERCCVIALVVFFLISYIFTPLYLFFHLFNVPTGYTARYIFGLSFLLCCVAARELSATEEFTRKRLIIISSVMAIGIIVVVLSVSFYGTVLGKLPNSRVLAGNIIFIILYVFSLLLRSKKTYSRIGNLAITLCVIAELSGNAYSLISEFGYIDRNIYLQRNNAEALIIDQFEKDKNFKSYRTYIANTYGYNDALLRDYNGTSLFSSGINTSLSDALKKQGDYVTSYVQDWKGSTDCMDMLYGVKFRGYIFPEDMQQSSYRESFIDINDGALPIAYPVNSKLTEVELGEECFDNQNLIVNGMTGEAESVFYKADDIRIAFDNLEIANVNGANVLSLLDIDRIGIATIMVPKMKYDQAYVYFSMNEDLGDMAKVYTFSNRDRRGTGWREGVNELQSVVQMGESEEQDCFVLNLYIENNGDNDSFSFSDINISYLDGEKLAENYRRLSEGVISEEKVSEYELEMTVKADDNEILFASIPYDKGWIAYVDGEKTETFGILNGAFTGVPVKSGKHKIILHYQVPGKECGIILTSIGVIMLLLSAYISFKKKSVPAKFKH